MKQRTAEVFVPISEARLFKRYDPAELGPCVTIDPGPDPEGVLENLANVIRWATPHNSVRQAIENLKNCTAQDDGGIAIVGIGAAGSIITGGGASYEPHKHISIENGNEWSADVQTLAGGSGVLTLFACDTGAGEAGRILLERVAALTNRPVRARTGLIYCSDHIYFEENTNWREVRPGEILPPTFRPVPKYAPFELPPTVAFDGHEIDAKEAPRLRVRPLAGGSPHDATDAFEVPLNAIDFMHPFTPPGEPLAPVTAEAFVRMDGDRGGEVLLLRIYADVVARDMSDPSRFYDVAPELTRALRTRSRDGG
ncbi:MAG TPA: hypothetical protein VF911_19610 [Thermoanaerobaculia bacterium]|jgi:hypothetical protein